VARIRVQRFTGFVWGAGLKRKNRDEFMNYIVRVINRYLLKVTGKPDTCHGEHLKLIHSLGIFFSLSQKPGNNQSHFVLS
jgi:hypothetical protein